MDRYRRGEEQDSNAIRNIFGWPVEAHNYVLLKRSYSTITIDVDSLD